MRIIFVYNLKWARTTLNLLLKNISFFKIYVKDTRATPIDIVLVSLKCPTHLFCF